MRTASRLALLPALLLFQAAAMAEEAVSAHLHERLGDLERAGFLEVAGRPILARDVLVPFYRQRGWRPAWSDGDRVRELLALLDTAEEHGLLPRDYHGAEIRQLQAEQAQAYSGARAADLDLLLTESLVRYGYHRTFGKVNPQRMEPAWNFRRAMRPGQTPVTTLEAALAAPSLQDFGREHLRRSRLYRGLQQALAEHRALAAAGGWPELDSGPTLRAGDQGERVAQLRRRLAASGDLPAVVPGDAGHFDETLLSGVRRFQRRHGLDADGVVGAQTLAALNVPVAARIDQLRLSLERFRWVKDEAVGSYLVVNIAGSEVFLVQEDRITWRRRAVVGRLLRQTPVFRGSMTYLELNPDWTIPPTILREDILPRVRRDPGYLERENIVLLDASGARVDPFSVDWAGLRHPPYTFRQEPGPHNALGQIKFAFPNPHFVFIHDTPARELFLRADRTLSSGCIRIEDPLSLAEIVLDEPERWTVATLRAAIATGHTRVLRLREPWPVLILYWTAEIDDRGEVRFLRDVYQRDARVLAALNGEVSIELP